MQDALHYRTWLNNQMNSSTGAPSTVYVKGSEGHDLRSIVEENPVIIFMKSGDCMGEVVKSLLQGVGINPVVYEIDEKDEKYVGSELMGKLKGGEEEERIEFPVSFIGGRLFGGLDRVMATHITGDLTLVLKQAGALL